MGIAYMIPLCGMHPRLLFGSCLWFCWHQLLKAAVYCSQELDYRASPSSLHAERSQQVSCIHTQQFYEWIAIQLWVNGSRTNYTLCDRYVWSRGFLAEGGLLSFKTRRDHSSGWRILPLWFWWYFLLGCCYCCLNVWVHVNRCSCRVLTSVSTCGKVKLSVWDVGNDTTLGGKAERTDSHTQPPT